MGDVTHIYTTDGTLVARYVYDAWGNHKIYDVNGNEVTKSMSDHIGNINPIRYRGYYYDSETELYYLEARYYDPDTGRFISQDSIDFIVSEHLTGLNLYAYCNNNPVMYSDPSGCFAITTFLITVGIGALIGGAISGGFAVADQVKQNGWDANAWDWKQIGLSTLGGIVAGGISSVPLGGWAGALAFGALGSLAGGMISGSVDSVESAIVAMSIGAIANVAAYGIGNKITNIKTQKIFNQSNKAKSLSVQRLQSHPSNMGSKALKGRYRNVFKNATEEEIEKLIKNAYSLIRYGVYSTVTSSTLSGWY